MKTLMRKALTRIVAAWERVAEWMILANPIVMMAACLAVGIIIAAWLFAIMQYVA